MTWSYNPADLSTNEVDQIRVEIGDTDTNRQLLQNEEIAWAISQERNLWAAAARCCEMISRLQLSKADVRIGRAMQVAYTKMSEQYDGMARRLRMKAMGTVVPYVGGMNVADKLALAGNSALVAPIFEKNMMENPNTGGYSSDSLGPTPSEQDDSGAEFE